MRAMEYTVGMEGNKQNWLLEMWKIKVDSWREAARLYTRSGVALLQAFIIPARELRKLEQRLSRSMRADEETVLRRTGKWFALLEKLGLRPSCLVRSLTLARVLRGEGYDAHLVFGVRSDNGDMEGHCWVAVGGRPVTEAPAGYEELEHG
jgi:hypothetical protein